MRPEEVYFWQAVAEGVGKECPQIYCSMLDAVEDEGCTGISLKTLSGEALLRTYGENAFFIREEILLPEFIQSLYEGKNQEGTDGISKNPVSI